MNNLDKKDFFVSPEDTLHLVMEKITNNRRGAVVVADENKTVRGIISDGDIRRAILKGATDLTPAEKLANPNVLTAAEGENSSTEAGSIFEENPGIMIVPVVDKNNRVVDIIAR